MALDEFSDEMLGTILSRQNPWWRQGGGTAHATAAPAYARKDLGGIVDELGDRRIHAVIGPRQAGKTTMLRQLAARLVGEGCDPRRVMYASLDEPPFASDLEHIRRALEWYVLEVVREPLDGISKRLYVLLDEAQEVDGWQGVLKGWVDREYDVKFVVSASSSLGILSGPSESLMGRIRHQEVAPLSFSEYVSLKGVGRAEQAGADMRGALAGALAAGDAGQFHKAARSASARLAPYADEITVRLSEYLVYGGRPGVAAVDDPGGKRAMLDDSLQLAMYRDIVRIGAVKSPALMDALLYMLAWKSPCTVNISRLARELDANRDTVKHYLHLLNASYIVHEAQLYSDDLGVTARAEKRAHIRDPGTRTAALRSSAADILDDPSDAGRTAASAVCDHTLRLARSYNAVDGQRMYYWRDGGGDGVDAVVRIGRAMLPVASRHRARVRESDVRGIRRFADRFGTRMGLVVSDAGVGLAGDGIVVVPLWLYLLMC